MSRNTNLPQKDELKGFVFEGYEFIKEIGYGKIGVVYEVYNKNIDYKRACKVIPKRI